MRVKEQFNRYADCYSSNSIIQERGAKILVHALPKSLGNTIDLGCGNGRIYRELFQNNNRVEHFYGVDFAESMLQLHPKGRDIELSVGDFDSQATFEKLQTVDATTLLSSSALQWAKDIEFTFNECAKLAPNGGFFLFSSGTFKTLHSVASASSPIYSSAELEKVFLKNYRAKKIEHYNFKLPFSSTYAMLQYIKKSGVSGNLQLSYRQMKAILNNYPLNYLEFETLLLLGESRCWQ